MKKIKCQIFRRTVKDRRRGDSFKLLYDFAEGISKVGDEVEIVHEHRTGGTVEGEMDITAPIGVMFGYGGSNQLHHTKGRRHELVENAKKKGSVVITFDGGLCSSFGNTAGIPNHRYRVSLWTPMRNGEFLAARRAPSEKHAGLLSFLSTAESRLLPKDTVPIPVSILTAVNIFVEYIDIAADTPMPLSSESLYVTYKEFVPNACDIPLPPSFR